MKTLFISMLAAASLASAAVEDSLTFNTTLTGPGTINKGNYYGWTLKLTDSFLTTTVTSGDTSAVFGDTSPLYLTSLTITNREGTNDTSNPSVKIAIYEYTGDAQVGAFVGLSTNATANSGSGQENTLTFQGVQLDPNKQYQFLFVSQDTTVEDLATSGLEGYQAKSDTFGLGIYEQDSLPAGDGLYTSDNLNSWQGRYLPKLSITTTNQSPAVPEPTTATLSLLALTGLCARRRRK